MIRAVFAIWVPLAAGFVTGRSSLVALPAMGAPLSVMIDTGGRTGPDAQDRHRRRVRRRGGAGGGLGDSRPQVDRGRRPCRGRGGAEAIHFSCHGL
jgi:hypothetical protein